MRLAIDIRPMQGETRYRGIGKALERTLAPLSILLREHNDEVIFIYDPKLPIPKLNNIKSDYSLEAYTTNPIHKLRFIRVIKRRFRLLDQISNDVDCVLQFDFTLGIPKKIPTVAIFHDLIPVLFREYDLLNLSRSSGLSRIKQKIGSMLQWQRYTKDLTSFRQASKILAISECSKNDLLQYDSHIDKDKIAVCHLGVDAKHTSTAHTISNSIKKIITEDYILYVGGIDTRKNIAQLITELYALKKSYPNLKLVAVGSEFSLKANLHQVGWTDALQKNKTFAKDVILPGYVSDYELQSLYQSAKCFVFPSLYEGFGLPILEAMAYSCPVVAYRNSCIPEIAGSAALLVDQNEMMASSIATIIEDKATRQDLMRRGIERQRQFPWSKTATIIYKNLRQVSEV